MAGEGKERGRWGKERQELRGKEQCGEEKTKIVEKEKKYGKIGKIYFGLKK